MTKEDLDKIAEALELLYDANEREQIVNRLNRDLPVSKRLASNGVATTEEDFLEAMKAIHNQFGRIMLSSGFNPWLQRSEPKEDDPDYVIKKKYYDLSQICTFSEFQSISGRLGEMSNAYSLMLLNIKMTKSDENWNKGS